MISVETEVFMPTLLRVGPYQFYIVMFDCRERMHVHVKGGGPGEAKFWLEPNINLAAHRGYTARDLARILAILNEHRATLIERWLDVCESQG
jgi:hypothetical protein